MDALGIRAESRVFRAKAGFQPLGYGWRATGPPGVHTAGWLKSAVGQATGSDLRTQEVPIGLDFTAQKSERPVMPQDTGVGRRVVLDGLDLASLRRAWEQIFGSAPPRSLSRALLCRVLACEHQCRTHGRHSAATRRALAAMVNGTPGPATRTGSVSAGTHLVREWNGRTYQVEVLDNGYRFDGKTYPSLTTITKRITGTHWSGPRFFGLTPPRKA